jgi:alpha-tubulin suppressor-like RCC1 family protein
MGRGKPFGGALRCDGSCQLSDAHCFEAVQVVTGSDHACALHSNGEVSCWGYNGTAQLGDGTSMERSGPVRVVDVAGATMLAAGDEHTCALLDTGRVKCWGRNVYGQLGRGSTNSFQGRAGEVRDITDAFFITAGDAYACAVLNDNTARCWGRNDQGQLGDGTTTDRSRPVRVLELHSISTMSAGRDHTCALDVLKGAHCWGSNVSGKLGAGVAAGTRREAPTPVMGALGATRIFAGSSHTCAILSVDNIARCWGSNQSGQLGGVAGMSSSTPIDVVDTEGATLEGVVQMALGTSHTCALLDDDSVWCWGANGSGQLADGSTTPSTSPTRATSVPASRGVSAHSLQSCVTTTEGRVRCWGFFHLHSAPKVTRTSSVELPL